MKKIAPILLFTYNRLNETQKTVKALQNNYLASESELFIFSDNGKDANGEKKVKKVRDYLKTIDGFKKVHIKEATTNLGLANSILNGVTEVINQYGKVIVLEDDLITSANFLDFMNQALNFYSNSSEVISISGYSLNLPSLKTHNADYYVGYRASSWGWGIWKSKWENVDWDVSDYSKFKGDYKQRIKFSKIGSDMPRMLKNQMSGKIDSWAIRLCYHQFKNNLVTIFPTKSKIYNIGTGKNATHTTIGTRFDAQLDSSNDRVFVFENDLIVNKKIISEFKSKFSIRLRAIDKLKKYLK